MAKYDITVSLIGKDGNAFGVLGTVSKALKAAGADKAEVDSYMKEAMSGDYNNLLRTTMDWVNVA
jgi:hypothetical protein